jgi:hypothetical protein
MLTVQGGLGYSGVDWEQQDLRGMEGGYLGVPQLEMVRFVSMRLHC